jgi:hypothetical protein
MSNIPWYPRRLMRAIAICPILVLCAGSARAQELRTPHAHDPELMVDGRIALHALVSLSDLHLQKMADALRLLAVTEAGRSAQWERIRAPLAEVAGMNVPAVTWFALPDGSYWSVQQGRESANLSDRPYWPRLLAGQAVVGDLVASRATGKSSAIVAVPVHGANGSVVGVLGSSIYLDSLSAQIARELHLEPEHLFYSLDAEPLVGLNSNPRIIFLRPMEEGDPDLAKAMREILRGDEGVVHYSFRGTPRTVLYRRSRVTGWWYGFGLVQP